MIPLSQFLGAGMTDVSTMAGSLQVFIFCFLILFLKRIKTKQNKTEQSQSKQNSQSDVRAQNRQ